MSIKMITTTLSKIIGTDVWEQYAREILTAVLPVSIDDPIPYTTIMDVVPFDPVLPEDAYNEPNPGTVLELLSADEKNKKIARLFVLYCARQVMQLSTRPEDHALFAVGERYANGTATDDELNRAVDIAWKVAHEICVAGENFEVIRFLIKAFNNWRHQHEHVHVEHASERAVDLIEDVSPKRSIARMRVLQEQEKELQRLFLEGV